MDSLMLIEDYLSDHENSMKNLTIWFLNLILQEAFQRVGNSHYERTDVRKAHWNGCKDRSLETQYGGYGALETAVP